MKSNQTGPVSGTKQHAEFAKNINAAGNSNLRTEVSFKNGVEVKYGTPGSVRVDVVEYNSKGQIVAMYDLKTGSASLTVARIQEIQKATNAYVPVIEIKPQ